MNRKEQVLLAAASLFSNQGFESTSMAQICEEAGVSKGLIYHHFRSKNEILRELFKQSTERMKSLSKGVEERGGPEDQLLKILEQLFAALRNDKEFFKFNLNLLLQPSLRGIVGELLEERSTALFETVHALFLQIKPKESELKTYLLLAELDGIALSYLSTFKDYPLAQVEQAMLERYRKV